MKKLLDDAYMQKVSTIYNATGSLQRTAEEMGIAYAKVRKMLITIGEYTTQFSEEVYTLYNKGYSTERIAKELGTTVKRVSAWMPYKKGVYNAPERSQEAIRSSNYRIRIESANQRFYKNKLSDKKEKEMKEMTIIAIEKELSANRKNTAAKVKGGEPIKLHLKLEEEEWLDSEGKRILKTYGRSSSGFSIERDILIPSDITLHALHYAIQRLFGWQNSHLHSFRLPNDVYKRLTDNTVRGWGNLVGVLFQTLYPDDVWDERYGDDDYESGSFKNWLRKKYTGPYDYLGFYEQYETAVNEYKEFIEWWPVVDVYEPFSMNTNAKRKIVKKAPILELTFDELLDASMLIEDSTEDLLERLLVSSVLAPEGKRTATTEELNLRMIKRTYRRYGTVEEPKVKPVTNKLIYEYDYGDGWEVEITRQKNGDDLIEKGLLSKEEYKDACSTVIEKHKPVCIRQDGMFLVDDIGGLGGFIRLLKTLYEPDEEEIDEQEKMREWAYWMGWSTRKVSNRMLL